MYDNDLTPTGNLHPGVLYGDINPNTQDARIILNGVEYYNPPKVFKSKPLKQVDITCHFCNGELEQPFPEHQEGVKSYHKSCLLFSSKLNIKGLSLNNE